MQEVQESQNDILDRPVFGKGERVFGQVLGSLFVEGPEQAKVLQRVLEDGMKSFAGRHEETFLAKLHREVVSMRRRAKDENWTGWQDDGGMDAIAISETPR